jgi:uncharacterized phage protein (TIGR01671 family)
MPRTLKFRVWSKAKQQWLENMALLACIDGLPFAHLVEKNTLDDSIKHHVHNMGNLKCIVQQFTGMFDKNGKEIFEGDILEVRGWRGFTGVAVVEWQEIEASDDAGRNSVGFPRFDDYEKPIVIGNIFQNTELLK